MNAIFIVFKSILHTLGEIKVSYLQKGGIYMPERNSGPVQRTHSEVDKAKKEFVQELKVGDIVAVRDDFYRVTTISLDKSKFSAFPVKYENGKWDLDYRRNFNFKDFNASEIQAKVASKEEAALRTDKNIAEQAKENQRQSNIDVSDTKNEEKEIQKNPEKAKEIKKAHAISFSVVSKGSVDGLVTGGNSYETIVTGTTENGVVFHASVAGGSMSYASIAAIADGIAKSRDYTNENLDERQAYDDVQDIVNQDPSIETVHIEGGPSITRDDLALEVSKPNGFEFSSDKSDTFDPFGSESLEDILASAKNYRPENPTIPSFVEEQSLVYDDGFEPGDEPWNNPFDD